MKYDVTFTLGGHITVDAASESDAEEQVDNMSNAEISAFSISKVWSVKEVAE